MKDLIIAIFIGLCCIITSLFYLIFAQNDTLKILAESHQELENWLKHPND